MQDDGDVYFLVGKNNPPPFPDQVCEEGYYSIFGKAGTHTEMPGCSLCMGNQARVGDNTTVKVISVAAA